MGIRAWAGRRRPAPVIQCPAMYDILARMPWVAWVPICAIICGSVVCMVVFIVKAIHRHEERMEMIKQGLHPSKIDDKE